jgi:hypothetical protein
MPVSTENLIRVDDGMESPKLAGRATADRHGAARIDLAYERRKSTLGRRAFAENCLSSGFRSCSRASPNTWSSGGSPPSQGMGTFRHVETHRFSHEPYDIPFVVAFLLVALIIAIGKIVWWIDLRYPDRPLDSSGLTFHSDLAPLASLPDQRAGIMPC